MASENPPPAADKAESDDDDGDFTKFRSPGGKDAFSKSSASPCVSPKSSGGDKLTTGLAPHVASPTVEPKDLGGGYKELKQPYLESLVNQAANPATPCQLIDADTYRILAKTLLCVEGSDRKKLIVWALGHGDTGIKHFVKSSKAKEVLAGLKLIEMLMVQVGPDFAREVLAPKWAERLYGVFYDSGEPILKMTIAQHVADWVEMFANTVDIKPLKAVQKKMAANARKNGGYGVAKPTAHAMKYAAANRDGKAKATPASPAKAPEEVEKPVEAEAKAGEKEEEVDDAPVRDAASPAPAEKAEVSEAAAKRADIIQKCFKRYDLDKSGTINTTEELNQLTTNLCFKLKILLPPGTVEKLVDEVDMEGKNWNVGEFTMWFDEAFDQAKKC